MRRGASNLRIFFLSLLQLARFRLCDELECGLLRRCECRMYFRDISLTLQSIRCASQESQRPKAISIPAVFFLSWRKTSIMHNLFFFSFRFELFFFRLLIL